MALTTGVIELTEVEAACLDAVREGIDTKIKIAARASSDFWAVSKALEILRRSQLVRRSRDARWEVTARGQNCLVRLVAEVKSQPSPKQVGKVVLGTSAHLLLSSLHGPMRGAELIELLGLSPQQVRKIVVKLLAYDRVRIGDRAHVLHIVARVDDPSDLLSRDEERVLSAFPREAAVVTTGLKAVTGLSATRVEHALRSLRDMEFVNADETNRGKSFYRLSSAGGSHFQRRSQARRAKPARLVVRSDRVREILTYLLDHGEARIRDVRDGLGIAGASITAQMQYLKRKNLIEKVGDERSAPYTLTDDGRAVLAEMERRTV